MSSHSGPPPESSTRTETDVVAIGAARAGLVAAAQMADAGRRVVLPQQEPDPIRGARSHLGDKLIRVAPPHRILDRDAGGMHGYRSLEGTFLRGCLFSGLVARRAVAVAL